MKAPLLIPSSYTLLCTDELAALRAEAERTGDVERLGLLERALGGDVLAILEVVGGGELCS